MVVPDAWSGIDELCAANGPYVVRMVFVCATKAACSFVTSQGVSDLEQRLTFDRKSERCDRS